MANDFAQLIVADCVLAKGNTQRNIHTCADPAIRASARTPTPDFCAVDKLCVRGQIRPSLDVGPSRCRIAADHYAFGGAENWRA